MGFRASTIDMQLAGYSNSFEYVGLTSLTREIASFAASPVQAIGFVREKSGEMRHRMDTLDRDINSALKDMMLPKMQADAKKVLTSAQVFAFHGIGYMDRVVSVPTWMAAYNDALAEGLDEEQAIYRADKAVRLSQGNADAKDLAAVARGTGQWGGALKLLTLFYSYVSAFYSRQRRLGRDIRSAADERDVSALPGIIARAWWLIILPPVLAELLAGRGPDDDENWAWWAFKKMVTQSLGAPGLRG
jgi:hypothetical protein